MPEAEAGIELLAWPFSDRSQVVVARGESWAVAMHPYAITHQTVRLVLTYAGMMRQGLPELDAAEASRDQLLPAAALRCALERGECAHGIAARAQVPAELARWRLAELGLDEPGCRCPDTAEEDDPAGVVLAFERGPESLSRKQRPKLRCLDGGSP